MPPLPQCVALAALIATPALAAAESLDCPDPAEVFAGDGASGTSARLGELSRLVGSEEMNGDSLHGAIEELRTDYPKATDAEVSDLMITAYCNFLNEDGSENQRTEANVRTFEQQVYSAVYTEGSRPEPKEHGWLYGN